MPATTPQGYPYPAGGDPIDVAGDIQRLAEAIDTLHVGTAAPTNPTVEMWWDSDEPAPVGFTRGDADLLYIPYIGNGGTQPITGPLWFENAAGSACIVLKNGDNTPHIAFQTMTGTSMGALSAQPGFLRLSVTGTTDGLDLYAGGRVAYVINGSFLVGKTAVLQTGKGVQMAIGGEVFVTREATGNNIVSNKEGAADVDNAAHCGFRSANVNIGTITRKTATTVAYNTTSHAPWKGNVADVDDDAALALVDGLRPVSFQWKLDATGHPTETGTPTGPTEYGFLAQELETVAPLAVTPGYGTEAEMQTWREAMEVYAAAAQARDVDPTVELPDNPGDNPFNPWMTDNSKLVPALVAAVRALIHKVAVLEGATP
jgi:hypothetical protein